MSHARAPHYTWSTLPQGGGSGSDHVGCGPERGGGVRVRRPIRSTTYSTMHALNCLCASRGQACKEYSRLKLRPEGPKALRTPTCMHGAPGLSPKEASHVAQSREIHRRSRELFKEAWQSLSNRPRAFNASKPSTDTWHGWMHASTACLLLNLGVSLQTTHASSM